MPPATSSLEFNGCEDDTNMGTILYRGRGLAWVSIDGAVWRDSKGQDCFNVPMAGTVKVRAKGCHCSKEGRPRVALGCMESLDLLQTLASFLEELYDHTKVQDIQGVMLLGDDRLNEAGYTFEALLRLDTFFFLTPRTWSTTLMGLPPAMRQSMR